MRMMEPQHQDENAMPTTASCSSQTAASPSSIGRAGHARSPSKMPTLSDIAARLNRDRETSTPGTSPMKQQLPNSSSNDAAATARPRLELTGRIIGSPKPPQGGNERKSPLMPPSPTKTSSLEIKQDEQSSTCLSPKAPSSGACSPTKRMLAKGLPSFEEIRVRMSRKGLAALSDEASPKMDSAPSSPKKLTTPLEIKPATDATPTAQSPSMIPTVNATRRPSLKVSTSAKTVPRLTHPLPATPVKASSHPLQHEWTLFFDTRTAGPSTPGFAPDSASSHAPPTPTLTTSSWEANLRTIGSYATVESFLGCFSKLHRPSQLDRHSSYHLFKDGIKPMWEDPRNANGGKWTITFRQRNPALVDRSWLWLVLGLIGEEMDGEDETCGAVCSVKPRGDRIALWVRDRRDVEKVNRIGKKLLSLLELEKEAGIMLEFTSHSNSTEEAKHEALFSVSNPVQQMARTPTVSTFNSAAAGLPNADTTRLAAAALTSPTSPNGSGKAFPFPRSPVSASPMSDAPFGRLSGQSNPNASGGGAGMFGRSPGAVASPNFGALGQSLGLGMGVNTSPSVSNTSTPNGGRNGAPAGGMGSWRSNRSASPQRSTGNVAGPKLGTLGEMGARSVSPFKAE